MITKYGKDVVIKFFLIAAIIIFWTLLFVGSGLLQFTIFAVIFFIAIFVLNFFRDPKRTMPLGAGLVLSPADGKIVLIKELFESEYLRQDAIQVSIFMSPLNVHVNRFPISGMVSYFRYIPGKYLVAFNEKSSELNERTHIGIDGNGYKLMFKQIAGTIARRIVADVAIGQKVAAGDRFGMIKFGSRVDVIVPKVSVVKVKLHDRVCAGESVIATYLKTTQGVS